MTNETVRVEPVVRRLELSKMVPARQKIQRFRWCVKNFTEMTPKYRKIREQTQSPMDKCDWCEHVFQDGEDMALAAPLKGRNWILCQRCADEVLSA